MTDQNYKAPVALNTSGFGRTKLRETRRREWRNLSACGVQSLLTASAQLKSRESVAAEPDSGCFIRVERVHEVALAAGIQRSAREMERLVRDLLDLSSLCRTRACAMLLHIGREPGLELAYQRGEAGHDGDRTKQRP